VHCVQVVPEELRTSVFAFDKCITGALGAVAAPLVGLLAERAFGGSRIISQDAAAGAATAAGRAEAAQENVRNARALENALMWVMVAAMALRFFIYGGLYWTLPRDRRAVARAKQDAEAEAAPETELCKGLAGKGGHSSGSSSGGRASSRASSMQRWSSDPPEQKLKSPKASPHMARCCSEPLSAGAESHV
jgi:hypothetical protein